MATSKRSRRYNKQSDGGATRPARLLSGKHAARRFHVVNEPQKGSLAVASPTKAQVVDVGYSSDDRLIAAPRSRFAQDKQHYNARTAMTSGH